MNHKPAEIVAEIGQAHDGSLGILYSLIDAAAGVGAKIIKFQMHIADAESSSKDEFRVNFSKEDTSRQDYWKRMELSYEQWRDVKQYCESIGCEFLCTPFSIKAVHQLEKLEVNRYKVGSGDITNLLLLDTISATGKPVILSSGLATYEELDRTVELFKENSIDTTILQCTSEYPVRPERWGLNLISELKSRYTCEVGLSDHSGTIFPGIAAVALGASLIEVHFSFDKRMFGPDAKASLSIEDLGLLIEGVEKVNCSLSNPQDKSLVGDREKMRKLFGRSLTVARDVKQNEIIKIEDLEAAKPFGYGIDPNNFRNVLKRRFKRDLSKGDFINESDIK